MAESERSEDLAIHESQESANQKPAGSKTRELGRALGIGLITGAADDDTSAIGTYASAGAKFGPALLWMAPVTFPMMFAVVYLSAKLVLLVPVIGAIIFSLQVWGSYKTMRNVFRLLALALSAYAPAAILARPDWAPVLKATLIPTIRFNRDFLSLVVAVIGTTLSAYLYTWQSNEEVEAEKAAGRVSLSQRRGATDHELRQSRRDVLFGMFFSNVAMYFIILATGATLFKTGRTDIDSAAQAAQSLAPLAGNAAKILFALGVIGVGFLAVPVMTAGAAYDLSQSIGWDYGLGKQPGQARRFYGSIAFFTAAAIAMNFLGINPMKTLVVAGIVQGFSTPPLMLLIMLMTNNREIMGNRKNGRAMNILGWTTTV